MTRRTRWILAICAAAILLPVAGLAALISWQSWRDHALLSFCKAAKTGISIEDLLNLERRHGVDESYLVQARFPEYIDQRHSRDLEFRSQWFDPDFACAIDHDGYFVTSVRLLTLEGFDPG